MSGSASAGPLLVFGPRSATYDFGARHPLTPRRFGPGIDLLRAVGATPGLAPEPAADEELLAIHAAAYLAGVRRFSADPGLTPAFGISSMGDVPPFRGMHDAAAAVAGGSLGAMSAILQGDIEHAFHPGGGLHHAMPARASGFCVYNDVALAISAARRAGLRVLYVDLDVHHGDGVEAIHRDDPGVMTVSFHESGRYLFPGTGFGDEIGDGMAAGTEVNVPFEPLTGETAWLEAVRAVVPALAAAFGPDVIVSQHGADSHAWDPLAHLRVTTTAMGEAARLIDAVAHLSAGGRWLATGGGGYEIYRVVPRAWALTWLAGAHLEVPDRIPDDWRERWTAEAARQDARPLPERFEDPPNAGFGRGPSQDAVDAQSLATVAGVRSQVLPRLLVVAEARSWWDPTADGAARTAPGAEMASAAGGSGGTPAVTGLDAETLERLRLAPRTLAPADPGRAMDVLSRAVRSGARLVGAIEGDALVGVALVVAGGDVGATSAGGVISRADELAALGVAPTMRRNGLATALLRSVVDDARQRGVGLVARIGAGERDVVEPVPLVTRLEIADRLLTRAGFRRSPAAAIGGLNEVLVYRRE
jgi:acetoin utilization protein AcuC